MVEEARTSHAAAGAGAEAEHQIHLPGPSIWPPTLGLGLALMLFGILTTWVFSLLGLLVFGYALARWIGELRHDASASPPEHATTV